MSIKNQLIKLILAVVVLATSVAALHSYRKSADNLAALYDKQLVVITQALANTLDSGSMPVLDGYFYQAWQGDVLVSQSALFNSNGIKLNALPNGFSERGFAGERYRLLRYEHDDLTIITAEPLSPRLSASEDLLLAGTLGSLLILPIMAVMIFAIVKQSLSPLNILSAKIKQKDRHDLSPFSLDKTVTELSPVVVKLNDLLARLHKAFEHEQQLTANIAHELRTPISVLSISAHNMKVSLAKNELNQSDLEELTQQIDRLKHVVEQIIALGRFNPEQFQAVASEVELEPLLQNLIADLYPRVMHARQEISLQGEAVTIQGHDFALTTLFENLIGNAIKYAGPRQQINVSIGEVDGDRVSVIVEDSGLGVNQSQLENLTQAFYRADNINSQVKGAGLGLAICAHIIALHNGTIEFGKSALGGLKVVLWLPIAKGANNE